MNSSQPLPDLIRNYLETVQVIQLSTAVDNQPWTCNVHFVADQKLNIYWLSNPSRRHSQEIAKNKKVSAAVAIKFPEHPVVGISVEGDAETISSSEAVELYNSRFNLSEDFKKKLLSGLADEKFYCLAPRQFVLFDEEKFPNSPRQQWSPGNT